MERMYECCCGIDVHAKTAVACVDTNGSKETRTFSTMTDGLLDLLDWLTQKGCTHVAIESTGVYWRPVFNILEGHLEVILANARDVRGVPGRKTDVKDSEWLADLAAHGLIKASFIPPRPIRELRELTRYRQSLIRDRTAVANRIQKVIESGNIKLGQVATDALGVSGLQMLRALANGETDAEKMSKFARARMKRKQPELKRALSGRLTEAQRWVLKELLDSYDRIEAAIRRAEEHIEEEIDNSEDPFLREAITLLDGIPGVALVVAEAIVAEMGTDMSCFPTDRHISKWAGMCPGNNESGGKRRSGKTTKGSRYLRAALVQAAWAASRTKNTYLAAQYRRMVKRMGRKKALVAVGHSILVMAYHILAARQNYKELGGDYFDHWNTDEHARRLVRQLQGLGFTVSLAKVA